jgi:isoleucyl-tRNA synthetase
LYRQEVIQHSYPYCYRSDTPLIYRAIPSWYVRVTAIKDNLKQANEKINWVPEHIKHGRFGNWLDGAIDWSISRNRVWGTPLPVWINDETGSALCVGSIEELYNYTGERVDDLHREYVDALTFQIDGEAGTYRRIEEVLDCWFESGSMPYAQLHYPFENEDVFKAGFPAEFIAEGLDQTRGWFYTLTVLGAALFERPAFRNVIVNGMVMAEDGKKMSKSLRNYTPPDDLMETYGADALRLYSINSGLVKGEEQRFADSGVRDMVRRALLPWYNAYSFLRT